MKVSKVVITCLLALTTLWGSIETAEAQVRRHKAKKAVVRHDVRVVHRRHHAVVVRRAHVHYAHLPRWRSTVRVVPTAAVVIRPGRNPYYYHDGIYYTSYNSSYVVVRPVRGIRIRVLPVGYRTVVVGPRNYYYYYGTFYTKPTTAEEYEVVDAPEGAVVDALPDGYEVKAIDGVEYYVLDDVYYAEVDAEEFEDGVGYEVVKI